MRRRGGLIRMMGREITWWIFEVEGGRFKGNDWHDLFSLNLFNKDE